MRRPLSTTRARRVSPRGDGAGFTFMEILVVMALAAVLLGLAVGFLTNAGKTTLTQQAAAILAESGQRCLNQSAGGGRALLELRMATTPDGDERVEVRTAVQRTVLTANFEPAPADRPGLEWFVYANGPEAATPTGNVKIEPKGHSGGAVAFQGAGVVDFGTRAVFAMTDGLEMEAWVRPSAAGRGVMTILRSDHEGQVLWAVQLLRESGQTEGWKVVLRASLVPADAGAGVMSAGLTEFKSKDAAVLPETWSHLRIGFDGLEPSLQVNGVERWARPVAPRGKEAATPRPMRLSAGASGTAHLLLSAPEAPFTGLVDTLNVAGIFRSDEDSRTLPVGVTLLRTPLPLEVSFLNGRLDPTVHGKDVEVRLQGPGDEASGGWVVIRFGLYGNIPPPYRVEPSLGGGS